MKIHQTRNYALFEQDPNNRPITDRDAGPLRRLEASMRKYGFLAQPVLVRRNHDKFVIIDGQHRFTVAQKLKLPILYVETDRDDIQISECAAAQLPWKVHDYVATFKAQGNPHYVELDAFQRETGLPLQTCAMLLRGVQPGASVAQTGVIRDGKFVVRNAQTARRIAGIVMAIRRHAVFATHSNCVAAVSRFVRIEEFNEERLIKKCESFPNLLRQCVSIDEYCKMFEEAYNHMARERLPLAFLAKEAANKRNRGRKSVSE